MYEPRSENSELVVSDMKLAEIRAAFQSRMTKLCHAIADRKAGKDENWKLRVRAIAQTLGIPWSRAKSYYYQESRRIDVEEFYVTQEVHEKLELRAVEQRAIRALEMANTSLLSVDSEIDEHNGELDGASLPASREMAQELRIRLAEI